MLIIHNLKAVKCVAALLVLLIAAVHASPLYAEEVRYVSGKLTLKMYKDSALSQLLPSLKTGDRVTILKRDDSYMQIKKEDGTIGWVKGNYLEEEKPAAIRLAEVQKELDELRSKHTDLLIEQPAEIPAPDNELQARVEAAETAQENMKLRMKELESERMAHIEELRELRQQSTASKLKDDPKKLLLWVILPILTLIAGFFVGFKYLEGKIKSRFGGFNPL